MTRKEFLAGAAGMAAAVAAAGAAMAQAPPRGEIGSARNLVHVRTTLEGLIDQLQRDRHDYDGYRVRAIAAMQQARGDLSLAINWDATHPY